MAPTPTPPLKGRGFHKPISWARRASAMTKAPALLPEGLRDRLPQQAETASRVTRALVDAMRSHGYGRVAPPLAEFRETLGGDDERSARDLLRFTDPVSQRPLALRPDITRQVGRIASAEEHTSELQSLMRISYAVFCLKTKTHTTDR